MPEEEVEGPSICWVSGNVYVTEECLNQFEGELVEQLQQKQPWGKKKYQGGGGGGGGQSGEAAVGSTELEAASLSNTFGQSVSSRGAGAWQMKTKESEECWMRDFPLNLSSRTWFDGE